MSFEEFHLIRPYWLLAIVPLLVMLWLLLRRQLNSGNWENLIVVIGKRCVIRNYCRIFYWVKKENGELGLFIRWVLLVYFLYWL